MLERANAASLALSDKAAAPTSTLCTIASANSQVSLWAVASAATNKTPICFHGTLDARDFPLPPLAGRLVVVWLGRVCISHTSVGEARVAQ